MPKTTTAVTSSGNPPAVIEASSGNPPAVIEAARGVGGDDDDEEEEDDDDKRAAREALGEGDDDADNGLKVQTDRLRRTLHPF